MNNTKIKDLIVILIIILTLIILLSSSIKRYLNNSVYQNATVYNINQKLWDFRKNGGIPIQVTASLLSYWSIAACSIFDNDIKNDMSTIDWNIFNTNELSALRAEKVSFYKGVPVFKFNNPRSGSFLAIFISKNQESINTLRHEFGHNIQQLILGPIKYLLCIGLPSWQEWSNRPYYDRPWEITADVFGGVLSRKHDISDIQRGYSYLYFSAIFNTLSYLFLENEFNYSN